MKKVLKIVIPALIVFVLSFMAYKIYAIIESKAKIAEQIKTIPEFYFYKLGTDSTFTHLNLKQNKSALIIYFHPECEHCQNEAEIISKRIDEFKEYQLVFISYAETQEIKTYASKHKLLGYENITFLEDKDMIFNDIFGKSGIPNSLIYSEQGKLTRQFKGEVKVDALLKYLKL
ncbi:MAG: redoxin domain-containing protein [Bacteroidales bacterium]|nr:redoxin domain-containing protein [Bacteroidales bacterium]